MSGRRPRALLAKAEFAVVAGSEQVLLDLAEDLPGRRWTCDLLALVDGRPDAGHGEAGQAGPVARARRGGMLAMVATAPTPADHHAALAPHAEGRAAGSHVATWRQGHRILHAPGAAAP